MIPPLDPATLSPPAQKILQGPPKMQEMAARGVALGVPPGELVLLLIALSTHPEPTIAELAQRTLSNLPAQVLNGALATQLSALAIHHLATRYHDQVDLLAKLISMPAIDVETILDVAKVCSEQACELLATNEERLLANPKLIETLYLNKHCRMSTADRIIELAVRNHVEVNLPAWREAAAAIANELIPEPSDEASPDDLLFKETVALGEQLRQDGENVEDAVEEQDEENARVKERYVPLAFRISQMPNSHKIRLAQVGTPEEIMILMTDPSPLVQNAAAKSPMLNDAIVEQIVKRKSISGEVLTTIGQKPELMKRITTKRDLMKHPKVPPSIALRLINYFQENELKRLADDRSVAGAVRQLIKNHLERKKR